MRPPSMRSQPIRALIRRSRRPRRASAAFTLVEILLVAVTGLFVFAAVTTMIVSNVRTRYRLESLLRLQDQWTRLQFLLEQDIQEGRSMAATASGCASGKGTLVLSLAVPLSLNPRIEYYLRPGSGRTGPELRRCGPMVSRDGQLVDIASDLLLLRGVSSFQMDLSDAQRPSFRLTLSGPGGVSYTNQSAPSGSQSRVREIN